MAYTFKQLHKMRVADLRTIAEGLEHEELQGFTTMHKEQLVPALTRAGRRVGAVTLREPAFEIADWSAYLRVIERYLMTDRLDQHKHRQLAPGIWSGRNVTISPTARLVGPVRDGGVVAARSFSQSFFR